MRRRKGSLGIYERQGKRWRMVQVTSIEPGARHWWWDPAETGREANYRHPRYAGYSEWYGPGWAIDRPDQCSTEYARWSNHYKLCRFIPL